MFYLKNILIKKNLQKKSYLKIEHPVQQNLDLRLEVVNEFIFLKFKEKFKKYLDIRGYKCIN